MRATMLAAVMACGLATGARADVVTDDINFAISAFAININGNNPTPVTPFDPTLGTLTSISVELKGTFSLPSYPLETTGYSPMPTSASVTPTLYVGGLAPVTFSFTTQANRPVVNNQIIGLQGFSFDVTGSAPLSRAASLSLDFSPYAVITNANGAFDTQGTADRDPSSVQGTALVSYTYTPAASAVPEPASAALLGIGGLATGLIRKSRKRAAPLAA